MAESMSRPGSRELPDPPREADCRYLRQRDLLEGGPGVVAEPVRQPAIDRVDQPAAGRARPRGGAVDGRPSPGVQRQRRRRCWSAGSRPRPWRCSSAGPAGRPRGAWRRTPRATPRAAGAYPSAGAGRVCPRVATVRRDRHGVLRSLGLPALGQTPDQRAGGVGRAGRPTSPRCRAPSAARRPCAGLPETRIGGQGAIGAGRRPG